MGSGDVKPVSRPTSKADHSAAIDSIKGVSWRASRGGMPEEEGCPPEGTRGGYINEWCLVQDHSVPRAISKQAR